MKEVHLSLFGNENVKMYVDEATTFAQLKDYIGEAYFVDTDMFYLTDEFQNLYSNDMILQDVEFGLGKKIYACLKVLGGGSKSCRYKKSSSGMRWKWRLKRQRRLQRIRRKMRRRAR